MIRSKKSTAAVFAALALFVVPSAAIASLAGKIVRVEAEETISGDSGFWEILLPPSPSDPFMWSLPSPINVYSTANPSNQLGRIDSLQVKLDGDPQVILNFAVVAGNTDTNFCIQSGTVSFSPLVNPLAVASAAITVTDNDGDGAVLTGLEPGIRAYEARYNGSSVYADLIQTPLIATSFSSASLSDRMPPVTGFLVIPGPVSSIESEFCFTLSANDSASGTSQFTVVPEPTTWALLGTGLIALAAVARRRRG